MDSLRVVVPLRDRDTSSCHAREIKRRRHQPQKQGLRASNVRIRCRRLSVTSSHLMNMLVINQS